MKRPLILITNDDSHKAKGIHELAKMVAELGEIIVCAPEQPQSGKSRAFSLTPLCLREISDTITQHPSSDAIKWYACNGTPVDCIKMACGVLCDRQPDLILSGINHGDNASTNAHYSGTVGAAFEGAIKGIPSIAFSLCDYDLDANFEPMTEIVKSQCMKVLSEGLPQKTFLNINVPKVNDASELKGLKTCRMARAKWLNEVEIMEGQKDAAGNQIYQLKGYFHNMESEAEDTDAWALAHGYAAITPGTIDYTA